MAVNGARVTADENDQCQPKQNVLDRGRRVEVAAPK